MTCILCERPSSEKLSTAPYDDDDDDEYSCYIISLNAVWIVSGAEGCVPWPCRRYTILPMITRQTYATEHAYATW